MQTKASNSPFSNFWANTSGSLSYTKFAKPSSCIYWVENQELTVIFLLQFDDLQPVVADAIVREATKEFYNNVLGDTQELRILEVNADKAMIQLQKKQVAHKKNNMIKGNRIVNRTQNPSGVS